MTPPKKDGSMKGKPDKPGKPQHPNKPPQPEPVPPDPVDPEPIPPHPEPEPPEPEPHPPEPEHPEEPEPPIEPPDPIEPPVEPEPPDGEGVPEFLPGDKIVHESVPASDPIYQPTEKDGLPVTAAEHAGYAVTSPRRFGPYPSPVINGGPVLNEEVQFEDVRAIMTYRQLPGQTGPSWWTVGADFASLPLNAEHYIEADLEFTGTPGANAIKMARLWCQGGQIQWSSHGDPLPYQGPSGTTNPFQVYPFGFTDEAVAYPDGHDQGTQPRGPYWPDLFNNGKHRFVWGCKGHSAPGVYDGWASQWIDGRKVTDVRLANVGVIPPDGTKQWTGIEMVKKIPVGLKVTEGFAIGGTQSTVDQPEWKLKLYVESFRWWARVP